RVSRDPPAQLRGGPDEQVSRVVRQVSRRRAGGRRALMSGAALLLGASPFVACIHRGPGDEAQGANSEIALEVESHNWNDIVIYLVKGSSVERLGTVGSLNTETFVFPFRRLGIGGDVRLRADPIGNSETFTSENLYVQPG